MTDPAPTTARDRAARAHAELLECIDSALTSGDPVAAVELLVDCVRAAAEQRVRAEREVGRLLRLYPDQGGAPPRGAPPTVARRLRAALGTTRAHHGELARLADVDDKAFEGVVDAMWSGFPTTMAPRSVVAAAEPMPCRMDPGE